MMESDMQVLFILLVGLVALVLVSIMAVMILIPIFRGIGWCVSHVLAFVGGEIRDTLRFVGAIITSTIFSFLVIVNILLFRWSASAHFGRAFQAEIAAGGACVYRVFVGHPARLLGLRSLVDGLENRVPEAIAAAPAADKPSRRTGIFENYKIIGSLKGGGSGGKLYIAEPDDIKLASFTRNGWNNVEQVVIKTFSLKDGSSLPQIVRESRSLDAAKKLGLVLDHALTPERFFYVMPYVPGESLGLVTQHLHAASPEDGLTNANIARVLGYAEHLVATLQRYHTGGLWHKDVKPDNIIIHGTEAHLVDFGLITPLRSAMTLTTHGTEYFRDPEMVRMALKGVKVHEVDGAKFDIYAAGAVLFSVIENSFPAHGGLSQISKRCPDSVRWIIRRAMADYDKRYTSAAAMLADLQYVSQSADAFAVKPAELPSFAGEPSHARPVVEVDASEFSFVPGVASARQRVKTSVAQAAASVGKAVASARTSRVSVLSASVGGRVTPKLRVRNWWSGKYDLADVPTPLSSKKSSIKERAKGQDSKAFLANIGAPVAGAGIGAAMPRRSAAEQIAAARSRMENRREHARARLHRNQHRRQGRRYASGINAGVAISIFLFLSLCVVLVGGVMFLSASPKSSWNGAVHIGPSAKEPNSAASDGSRLATATAGTGNSSVASSVAGANTANVSEISKTFAPPLPSLGGHVLVVNDLLPPFDAHVESMLRSGFSAMQQAGLEVLGTFPGLKLDQATSEQAIELIAEARKARAQAPLESADTNHLMTQWLDANENADVLVWIVPGESAGKKPRVYVFAASKILKSAPANYIPSIQQFLSLPG